MKIENEYYPAVAPDKKLKGGMNKIIYHINNGVKEEHTREYVPEEDFTEEEKLIWKGFKKNHK